MMVREDITNWLKSNRDTMTTQQLCSKVRKLKIENWLKKDVIESIKTSQWSKLGNEFFSVFCTIDRKKFKKEFNEVKLVWKAFGKEYQTLCDEH